MSTVKKKLIHNTTAVSVGCGSSCRRINFSKIFHPKPKRNRYAQHHHESSASASASASTASSWNTTPTATTAATLSPTTSSDDQVRISSSRAVQGFGWLGGNSLAVEKDSSDPYVDFRDSMLQMITEKQIYGKDDLRQLLNCFLQLNSPYYHGIIVRAFTEIWNNLSN